MLDSDIRRWAVCERGDRWLTAVRRFGPAMTPPPLVLEVIESDSTSICDVPAPDVPALETPSPATPVLGMLGPAPLASNSVLASGVSTIVLWEVEPDSLREAAQRFIRTAERFPHALQLVAERGLSCRERVLLSEFPIALLLQHPEQLPKLRPLVEGHFASAAQPVDLTADW